MKTKNFAAIITASSVGTLIEWYDFFIFGSLATIISTQFFPKENPTAAFLATLAVFSSGLVMRPFGALFFGRLGDIIGRKYTFMVTLVMMGGSTIAIGLVPTYQTIGFFAPLIVLILRLLQGLAIGGEYGGAATYVAEQSPVNKRGFWTSWIQASSAIAFLLSLVVILVTKSLMNAHSWETWGWRLPFLVSIFMVAISVYMRKNMAESPLFAKAKSEGKTSSNPLKESFGKKENLKIVLLVFFGLTMGGGTIGWIDVYSQSFMLRTMQLDYNQANEIMVVGILACFPFYLFFGWLSDKIGGKYILLLGMFAGIIFFRPIFSQMYQITDVQHKTEIKPANSSNVPQKNNLRFYSDGTELEHQEKNIIENGKTKSITIESVLVNNKDKLKLIFLAFLLQFIFILSYAPLASFIVAMFPLKIRYTSLSVPYHFGYGIFGGMAPYVASYLVQKATEANKPEYYLAGLTYPIVLLTVSVVIGVLYLKEPKTATRVAKNHFSGNRLKRGLGIVWILTGIVAAWFGIFKMGIPKIISGNQEDIVFGIIMTFIITPIAVTGFLLFGKYSWQGEYDDKKIIRDIPMENAAIQVIN